MSHYKKAYFLLSAADVKQLPPDQGIEVAIVGRSNTGKSSIINKITQSKNLARVSKTPGRTQMINIFVIDENRRLMDLPGYGYAKVPPAIKRTWEKTVSTYFNERDCLKGLILVMDIRHPLKDTDIAMIEFCQEADLPVHIVLNKADKLSKSTQHQTVLKVRTALTCYDNIVTLQSFSALKGIGTKDLYAVIDKWFEYN